MCNNFSLSRLFTKRFFQQLKRVNGTLHKCIPHSSINGFVKRVVIDSSRQKSGVLLMCIKEMSSISFMLLNCFVF